MVRLNARAELDKVPWRGGARILGGGPASKRTLRAALFAPDSGACSRASRPGVRSLVVAALIGVPLGVLAAKVGWLAQRVSADRTGADDPVACPARVPDPLTAGSGCGRPDRVVPVCAFADHAQHARGLAQVRAGCSSGNGARPVIKGYSLQDRAAACGETIMAGVKTRR